ncbi:hypothetical protein [Cellulosilyticum sp. I15G10I2]|uniref:hypothetical protein n=1 Tax=Cellulosilyticum sp. I15G10I2 TaxID=1892843 RepID=UPI00085BFE70|nr:hypothetical protein [Cellulosilyticum sp. I15G10I2]
MPVAYNCKHCGKEILSDMVWEGKVSDFPKFLESKINQLSQQCECNNDYYFEYNKNAHSVHDLDLVFENDDITLREYIEYGEVSGYITLDKPLEDMTTSELSRLVDFIEYLDTK